MRKLEIIEAVPEWFNLAGRTLEIRATSTFRPKDRDARTVPLTDQFVEFLNGFASRESRRRSNCDMQLRTEKARLIKSHFRGPDAEDDSFFFVLDVPGKVPGLPV